MRILFSYLILILIFPNDASSSKSWQDFEVSIKNTAVLATGIVESPENIELKLKDCERYKAKDLKNKICTSSNHQAVDDIIKASSLFEQSTIDEVIEDLSVYNGNWKDRFPECNKDFDEKEKIIESTTKWITRLSKRRSSSSREKIIDYFLKDFKIEDEDVKAFSIWCQGEGPPPNRNVIPILVTSSMLYNIKNKDKVRGFCADLNKPDVVNSIDDYKKTKIIDFINSTVRSSSIVDFLTGSVSKKPFNKKYTADNIRSNFFSPLTPQFIQ